MIIRASRPTVLALCVASCVASIARAQDGHAGPAVPAPVAADPARVDPAMLDPSSPLDEIPDFGVDWPELGEAEVAADAEPGSDAVAMPETGVEESVATEPAAPIDGDREQRYAVVLEGLEAIEDDAFRARFEALSTLHINQKSGANSAQIDRRAREDETTLRELLRAEGYYSATVSTRVEAGEDRLIVRLRVDPGPLYTFAEVTVDGLIAAGTEAAEARSAFNVVPGDPVNAEAVVAATQRLARRLADHGYPFAKVPDPEVTIDHADHEGLLALTVDPGSYSRFGRILLEGNPPFGPRHVGRIARFKPGETYNAADMDDLRRALIATGLVSTVSITPVPATEPGIVDIAVGLEPAPMRTIAGELGYGTGEGLRAAVSWTHRNLIRPEGAVTFRGVAGTREQYLGALLRRSNFRKRDQVLTGQIFASHVDRDAYNARTFTVAAGIERQTNIIWQKTWTWSVGPELTASQERDTNLATGEPRRRTFYIAAFPGTIAYDGSDDLLDPKKGFRLSGRLSPEVSFHAGSFTYARAQLDASFYQPLGSNVVVAGRTRVGTIAGAKRDRIAPSRRFYAGGGGSVRGYGYQDIGPRDVDNDPIGGRSISEFSLEARIRFGSFGVVPFLDGGNIYTDPLPRFTDLRYGAGLGVRYYTSFGPIRLDVGTPLNRRAGDSRVAVYVSLGQAF